MGGVKDKSRFLTNRVAPWDTSHAHREDRSEISDFGDKAAVQEIWFFRGMMVERGKPVTSRWLVQGSSAWHVITPAPAADRDREPPDPFAVAAPAPDAAQP